MRGRGGGRWWVLLVALLASTAQARVLSGVRLPDTISLRGEKLLLEHMALKRMLFWDVYVWGLYLEEKPRTAREAVAADKPKQLQMHFQRNIRRDQLAKAFRDFLRQSTAMRSPEMQRQAELLVRSLRPVRKGDSLLITYLPGQGLLVSGEASRGAFIPGKDFADVLFDAWLKENPIYD
jgi:hypothetical protein